MAEPNLSGFSPEIQAWIMGLGPNPFAMYEDQNAQVIGNWLPPEDLDEIGTMDWQNARLTAQGKANNVYSDTAQIAQLGNSTGGFAPGDFEPWATYEPVQAPGYMTLNYYKASSDPIMSYVAKRFEEGATSLQVETEVRKLVEADPEAAAAMPVYLNEMTQKNEPDWKRLGAQISKLESDILNDPQFNGFDPATGLPANVKYEETEAAKYFRERGLPNPYETYDPDLLAGEDTLRREGSNIERGKESDIAYEAARRGLLAAQSQADPRRRNAPRGMTVDPMMQQQGGGGSPDPAAWLDRNIGDPIEEAIGRIGWHPRPTTGSIGNVTRPPAAPGAVQRPNPQGTAFRDAITQGGADRKAANAVRAASQAYLDREKRRDVSARDKIAQIDRQRMMAMLTKQGYTPFNDVNRARQGNVYGF